MLWAVTSIVVQQQRVHAPVHVLVLVPVPVPVLVHEPVHVCEHVHVLVLVPVPVPVPVLVHEPELVCEHAHMLCALAFALVLVLVPELAPVPVPELVPVPVHEPLLVHALHALAFGHVHVHSPVLRALAFGPVHVHVQSHSVWHAHVLAPGPVHAPASGCARALQSDSRGLLHPFQPKANVIAAVSDPLVESSSV